MKNKLFQTLCEWKEKSTLPPCPVRFLKFNFIENSGKCVNNAHSQSSTVLPFAKTDVMQALIQNARTIVPTMDNKTVTEMVLKLKNQLDFLPGDTIGILPSNLEDEVDFVLQATGLESKRSDGIEISVLNTSKTKKIPIHIPRISTPLKIITECLDLRCIPKKLFIRSLLEFTDDEDERNLMKVLCSKEGAKMYSELIVEGKITFIDLLRSLNSCRPDFSILLEHLPRLQPRPYSVANSPLQSPDELKIVYSVLETNPGLTTQFLQKLSKTYTEYQLKEQPLKVHCYLRQSNSFRYSEFEKDKNLIMIGIGCAISPYLGFMEHKQIFESNTYQTWLIAGYRHPDCAVYFEEMENFFKKGILTRFDTCFSRDENSKYRYIQDCIHKCAEDFVNLLLQENTILYVCADGLSISKDIQNSISKAIEIVMNCDRVIAEDTISNLRKQKRYREDIWI